MGTMTPTLNCVGMASKSLKALQSQDLKRGPAQMRCCGEKESGPAELLHLRRLIAASTSSSRKDASRIFSSFTRVASQHSG